MATLLNETEIAWARPRIAYYPPAEAKALEGELKNRIQGEVRFDDGSRALYATDGSNYRQVPMPDMAGSSCARNKTANICPYRSYPASKSTSV